MKKLLYFCLCAGLYFLSNTISIQATTYEYDNLGRVTQVTDEDGNSVTYVYDANGNIVEIMTENVSNCDDADSDKTESTGRINGLTQSDGEGASDEYMDESETEREHVISTNRIDDNRISDSGIDEDRSMDDRAYELVADQIAQDAESGKKNTGIKALAALLAIGAVSGVAFILIKIFGKKKEAEEGEKENE